MHIALVGWCSPRDLVGLLHPDDASVASRIVGHQAASAVSELAKGLVEAGHRVTFVTTDPSPEVDSIDLHGPEFHLAIRPARPRPRHHLPDLYAIERRAMVDVLRDTKPEIVHAHWTYEFELAAQDSGLQHVTTARDAPWTILRHVPDAYRLARLGVAWRARPGIRNLVVASPYMLDAWRRQMLYSRMITIIPNMAPELPAVERVKSGIPTAICVADPSPRKNIEGLVRSFRKVRREIPEARLRLVGQGLGELDPLAGRLAAAGVTEGIDFLGPLRREKLAVEVAAAWCLVHPSLEESFGNTLVEAMMLGTPVIGGRDSGAVPWVLAEGAAGTLVDVRSPRALSDAILAHLERAPRSVPEVAHELLQSRYSREAVVDAHLRMYASAMD